MYHTFIEGKAVVIERFNQTFKRVMWKYFTTHSTNKYIDVLQDMVQHYNKTKHSSIKMSPIAASNFKNRGQYQVGDQVRISKYKRHFEKSYTPNWTEEIFVVDTILETDPVTYQLKYLNGESILGSSYGQELIHAKQSIFRIEK
ncbi:YMD3-like protein, partial [Mya arenaria]